MKKEIIKAVIFDMDGVLVDSQPLHFEADIRVLKLLGVDATLDTVRRYAGMSNADRWAKYKHDFNLNEPLDEITGTHTRIIGGLLTSSDISAVPYAAALLKSLKRRGVACSVASSSSYDFVYKMLDKIALTSYFDIIISGEDMQKSKPAPDIFIHAAARHGADPSECLIIEDSSNGVKAAHAAKIRCIGYENPSSGSQDLSLADFTISSFNSLLLDDSWLYKQDLGASPQTP